MSKRIVISCFPDGVVQHTRDKTFSLPGKQSIKRVSEIVFNETAQKWEIYFRLNGFVGKDFHIADGEPVSEAMFIQYSGSDAKWGGAQCQPMHFDTYELAVEKEVELLNLMRLQGMRFDHAGPVSPR